MAGIDATQWKGEAICGLALTSLGLAFAAAASRMQLVDESSPGPGMGPLALGVILAALGLAIALKAFAARASKLIPLLDRETVLAVAFMTLAVVFFERAGYVLSCFAFLWGSFVLIGREPWLPAGLFAATGTMLTWALFVKALGVGLPAGLLTFP